MAACRRMGDLGAELIPERARVLTHCNAGALATAGYGTALGVIRSAARQGKVRHVFADETRPYLQGARLTAWELMQDGIPTTLIADNMAGHLMARGEVDAVVVGADRIAANGDVANKIGTYTRGGAGQGERPPVLRGRAGRPPSTSRTPDGRRHPDRGARRPRRSRTTAAGAWRPRASRVRNPAFDVTPHRYVTAIVCERGVARPPYTETPGARWRGG